jgi:hypothetical protein
MESHWGNRDLVAKGGHLKGANAMRGTRMRAVELSDEVWCLHITFILLGVLFVTISLPLDEELQSKLKFFRNLSKCLPHLLKNSTFFPNQGEPFQHANNKQLRLQEEKITVVIQTRAMV